MLLLVVLFFSLLESVMSINAVVSVWLAFLVVCSPKTKIGTDFYVFLGYLSSQTAMVSTKRGRDYREEADVAAAIAAVAAAIDAATEADTSAAAIAAVAAASEAKVAATKSISDVIFDFASSNREDADVATAIAAVAAASDAATEAETSAAAIAAVAAASVAEAGSTDALEAEILEFASSVELDEGVAGADGKADIVIGASDDISDGNDQGDGDDGDVAFMRVTKKGKSEMKGNELYVHFDNHLKGMGSCPNQRCQCLDVLADGDIRASVARYLCWFERKSKYDQDSIVFEWFKYSALRKSADNVQMYWFCLPYVNDGAADAVENVPDEFQSDELYVEPSAEVWKRVKTEKIDRSEFRAKLKVTKYSKDKERIESLAFDEGEGKSALDEGEGKV